MAIQRIFQCITIGILLTIPLNGSASKISLAKEISLSWSESLQLSPAYANNFSMFILANDQLDPDTRVYVQKQNPPTIPNEFIVQKHWQLILQQQEELQEKSTNKGCNKIKPLVWQCIRFATTNENRSIVEKILWYQSKYFISIRVVSGMPHNRAENYLQNFKFEIDQRENSK